ncbi:MAG: ATP-dependent DNA helicase [Planctomycetota bacterium]|jgi:ATP-dependent DNA helicase DinG
MDDVFAPVAKEIPGFENRPGQIRMEQAVDGALAAGEHLCVEAPCGIGKTFAYLLPAIRHATANDCSVVVCTANIALQEQLIDKDLPALARALPERFSFALIKGMNNYLCLDRFKEAEKEMLLDKKELKQFQKLCRWAAKTVTGDKTDLGFEPMKTVWNAVNGVAELCTGSKCPDHDDCYAMGARRKLRTANIIVCNYHLLFAHLRVRMAAGRDLVLPPFRYLICDEAHETADVARDFFGLRLTPWSIFHLLRAANVLGMEKAADRMRKESRTFFDDVARRVPARGREVRIREAGYADGRPLAKAVRSFRADLRSMLRAAGDDESRDRLTKFVMASDNYIETLKAFQSVDDENMVYWISADAKGNARLMSTLIDASDILRKNLFGELGSVVCTSATLTTGGTFDFLRGELGLDEAREEVVPSPFDFPSQCRIVIPKMRSGPNDGGFQDEISGKINEILEALGGRTMCLFTSYRNLNACAEAAEETGVTILKQGTLPRTKLLNKFRKDKGSALFATASFWQGVDVPGRALSCLVIDKLPFIPPDNPLLSALQERDPECFMNHSLPRAILDLRQGFGQLIRRKDDRGVVVILDRRLRAARYGRTVLKSLPDAPVGDDISVVGSFLGR